jgi:omega-6 fatty acid desaturase (delta-12 desaturase)
LTQAPANALSWNQILAPYKQSHLGKALFQLVTTCCLFGFGWYLMLRSMEVSYLWTILLGIPMSGLLTRLFIFQHDCGHGSFFRSSKANHAVGFLLGVVTLTPYHYWRRTHAIHHATSGDLDHREMGDITTLTVDEYLALPPLGRLRYRLYRSMFVLLVVAPLFQFGLKHRFPYDIPWSWKREWASVLWTDLVLAGIFTLAHFTIGIGTLLLVHLPILVISGALGIWLFYVQHQFEDTYWENHPKWDFHRAGIEGSSFLDMPGWLHWLTGNIGYHHIHHLSSRIPNYSLRRCMAEVPELQHVTRLTALGTLECGRLKLWDEESRRLVGFRDLPEILARRSEAQTAAGG